MTWKRVKLALKKLVKDNKEKEMTVVMYQSLQTGRIEPDDNMTLADLNVLSSLIEKNIRDVSRRLETLNANEMTPNQLQMQTPAPAVAPEEMTLTLLNDGDGSNMSANGDLHNGNGV